MLTTLLHTIKKNYEALTAKNYKLEL